MVTDWYALVEVGPRSLSFSDQIESHETTTSYAQVQGVRDQLPCYKYNVQRRTQFRSKRWLSYPGLF